MEKALQCRAFTRIYQYISRDIYDGVPEDVSRPLFRSFSAVSSIKLIWNSVCIVGKLFNLEVSQIPKQMLNHSFSD